MTYKLFARESLERAVKSAAQFALIAWGTVMFTDVGQVMSVGQATALAAVFGFGLSVLTSIASAPFGDKGTPSLVKEDDHGG
jgi:hypothetical protein